VQPVGDRSPKQLQDHNGASDAAKQQLQQDASASGIDVRERGD
jgi:hypothetical protein